MTYSKGLFWILISFILGIAAESFYQFPKMIILGFLLLGFLISFLPFFSEKIIQQKRLCIVLGFCLLCFFLGALRMQIVQFEIEHDPIAKLNDASGKITLLGQIIDQPDVRSNYQNIKIKVQGTNSIVLASVDRRQTYHYLDEVAVTGNLTTPTSEGDFNYKNYLLKDGIYSLMAFPSIEITSKNHQYNVFSFWYEKILLLKAKMEESIQSNYSAPGSFIIEGVILGNDKNMSKELKDKFNAAGLSHITAVSGSNIVIMTSIVISLLLFLGLWRQQALYFTLIFIWVYVVLVGLPASAVRAAIMASIFIMSQIFGRQNTTSRTIIIAAAIMLFQNPFLLLYDVGFQLSFLASLALVYLKPIIDNAFYSFIKKRERLSVVFKKLRFKTLWDIFSTTLSVQLFTLPIIIYNFKLISVVALATNLLILPTITILTFFGFWSIVFGMFSRFLAWVLYLPCQVMLIYFVKILDIFFQPWARLSLTISLLMFFVYYVFLCMFIWFINRKVKPEFLEF